MYTQTNSHTHTHTYTCYTFMTNKTLDCRKKHFNKFQTNKQTKIIHTLINNSIKVNLFKLTRKKERTKMLKT